MKTHNSRKIFMHREIAKRMGLDLSNEIDHKDNNGLNNRRENLRTATHAQNNQNKGKSKNNTSGYKGVNWEKRRNKWRARIYFNKNYIHLGYFNDIEEAAKAYEKAAKKYHGKFARIE